MKILADKLEEKNTRSTLNFGLLYAKFCAKSKLILDESWLFPKNRRQEMMRLPDKGLYDDGDDDGDDDDDVDAW